MRHGKHLTVKETPQTEKVIGKKQVQNDEGGYVFQVTPQQQLLRFLILGTEGGTYYASEKDSTLKNTESLIQLIKDNGPEAVKTIVEVSEQGRAPKNSPAVFALALAVTYGTAETKKLAYDAVVKVCRTGTHLFQFCQDVQDLRGWSRGLRRGVSRFYEGDQLDYQLIKYRQRDGWTHRDVLRLCHAHSDKNNQLLRYAVGKEADLKNLPLIQAFEEAQIASAEQLLKLIAKHPLSWEMLPTEQLKDIRVWQALLPKMPLTALTRNLARMTSIGVFQDTDNKKLVVNKLTNQEHLKKSRVHPVQLLIALRTYASGKGEKGSLTWAPNPMILDALDDAVSLAFNAIEPTGKRFLLGVDVSGSMQGSRISGTSLTAREGAACMALTTAKAEKDYHVMAFSGDFIELPITKKSSFKDAMTITSGLDFNSTDCSLPMLYALKHKLKVDCFCVYTDNETYMGNIHPFQALKKYRQEMGINAKLMVCGMTSNEFTIADPSDTGMLDVVGFDTATPQIISEFAKG